MQSTEGSWKNTEAHVPVIAITAYAVERDREECLEAGMEGYTSKLMTAKQLCEAIERVLHRLEESACAERRL